MKRKGAIIGIIGASGVGKTFLAKRLAHVLHGTALLEKDWNDFPEKIRKIFITQKDIIQLHLWFREEMLKTHTQAELIKQKGNTAILDTFAAMNIMYARAYLKGDEQKEMIALLKKDIQKFPKPDYIIHLTASEKYRSTKVHDRGRVYEQSEGNQNANMRVKRDMESFAEKRGIITIKRDNLDFKRKEDVEKIIKKLNI